MIRHALIISLLTCAALAQEDKDSLDALGTTLKAAVMSGTMSEKDAMAVYEIMVDRLLPPATSMKPESGPGEGIPMMPDTGRVRALDRPDMLPRDARSLRIWLDLDADQAMLTEALLRGYTEGMRLMTAPLRDAIVRHRRSREDAWLAEVLDRARIDDIDLAVANTSRYIESIDIDDEEGWSEQMIQATTEMEGRLATLRQRVRDDLEQLDEAPVTADQVVRLAKTLRQDRQELLDVLMQDLALIILDDDTTRQQFDLALARLRLHNALPKGRMAGESIDPWRAADDADLSDELHPMLLERAPSLLALTQARDDARFEREIRGLEFERSRERIGDDPERLAGAIKPYVAACNREITASIRLRDALLDLIGAGAAMIDQPARADAFTHEAWRQGFPDETRLRWSELALRAAADLNLDAPARTDLESLSTTTRDRLLTVRKDAIAKRIRRDEALARRMVDIQFQGEDKDFDDPESLWRGINHEQFTAIDEQTEARLAALLSTEAMSELPTRRRSAKRIEKD